jgi:hypothetical protein
MRPGTFLVGLVVAAACDGGANPEDFEQFSWHYSWSSCLKGEVCETNVDVFATGQANVSSQGTLYGGMLEPSFFAEFRGFLVEGDTIRGLRTGAGCSGSDGRTSDSRAVVALKLRDMEPISRDMSRCRGGIFPRLEQWVARITGMFIKM